MANWTHYKAKNSRNGRHSDRLDLHGVRHHEVDLLVENFILLNQNKIPLSIICGNSQRMIDLVYEVINRIGCETVVMDQYGVIVIRNV